MSVCLSVCVYVRVSVWYERKAAEGSIFASIYIYRQEVLKTDPILHVHKIMNYETQFEIVKITQSQKA